ncbi:uncharacterized protein LOC124531757 [Vanessa cardui]|uniref:uncharacterized protein LOC124531757 n=1 Tax=Vanessa cardui TaxID=171605 RepID=UPI001F12958A|nr:uncharacterized protein LOC124531757 [Vanessa cardui]
MQPATEILSFMDLLDLDEEIIDDRAKNIMDRNTFTNEHLSNFINLLQYKQLINTRENSECSNDEEYNFVAKLILNANEDNVENICKIIKMVLMLHPSSIINKSEHLLQQIMADMYLPSPKVTLTTDNENEDLRTTLLQLKICVSILDAVTLSNTKLLLPFLDIPLENIIFSKNEKLRVYFLTHAVPQFFEGITGYNILDRVWNSLRQYKDNVGEIALQVLCCLSNYYLPVADKSNKITIESDVIIHSEFWDFVLSGLLNKDVDNTHRKKSIYLAKRAIDCVYISDKNINIRSTSIFIWDRKNKITLKNIWDNYFILIDSLEEKQSNIVLPSLKLFETVKGIGNCWLNCAFYIGLRHDNAQVRYQCLQYRMRLKIASELEAVSIFEAINDINLFENDSEYETLEMELKNILNDTDSLINVLKGAPLIKWSPVPLYNLTTTLSEIRHEGLLDINCPNLMEIIVNILKIPCNNIVIRKAIQVNMSYFIGNNCRQFTWKEYMNIYPHLYLDFATHNPLAEFIKKKLIIPDIKQFLQLLPFSHINIDFAMTYYEGHDNTDFVQLIHDIVKNIKDINFRQYSNKNECLNDVIFIVQLYKKAIKYKCALYEQLNDSAPATLETILQYVASLLINDITFDIEKITLLFEGLDCMSLHINKTNENDYLIQLYKSTILILNSNISDLNKKALSIFILNTCLKAPFLVENYEQEVRDVDTFINMVKVVKFNESIHKENSGRLRNLFYEKSCEIVYFLLSDTYYKINNDILDYIYNVLDSGGYGCLKWILMIINKILPSIINNKDINFNVTEFLNRIWKEIEELKSNSQYMKCIQEFVIIITQDAILVRPEYNNVVVLYSNKILEYAAIKNTPLYCLVKQMNEINVSAYSHMIYVLCEILIYGFVPKKDHRIAESVSVEILQDKKYGVNKEGLIFNSHIKVLAVSILSKIDDPDILNTVTCFIIKKVEDLFRNKQRYYGNSLHDRSLQAAVQSLIFIFFKCRKVNLDNVLTWALNFLGKIPHQPLVKTYFEWYTALVYYYKGNIINGNVLTRFKENNVPIQSQFIILYWIITHKLKLSCCRNEEFECVMDFFLANIMGPIYSTRLYAQYLSTRLYETATLSSTTIDCDKYSYSVDVITKTLQDAEKAKDKSYTKLINDYFVHIFDIVEDLTPFAIYWGVPQMYDGFNDIIETDFLSNYLGDISECITGEPDDKLFKEWKEKHKYNWFKKRSNRTQEHNRLYDNLEEAQTIQKKYVPWKNMIDIDVYTNEKKKNKSDLIVVASLIDKLPNLGGMARTSEVFGVQTYVVDSKRHLQDKQFQGLSVSAERWINVEEVRPGQPLKEYLMKKKAEGYSIVAAEQTSTSTPLQKFKFPKKTLLLLGHEKEGIPCDLLPLMEHCVEIPQQGVIRSLNVHVTAAIFVWEYARQNML